MWTNYLKIAWRNLTRQKGYTAINVFGLAVGLAACLLMALFVQHEWSHDRFHEQADRIFRVLEQDTTASEGSEWTAQLQGPMGPALEQDFGEVESAVRFHPEGETLFRYEEHRFHEEGGYRTEESFFDVFSFSLKQGNRQTALTTADAIVLTESLAEKYFGEENPLGRTLTIDDGELRTVTGVVGDPPPNSQIHFSYLVPLPQEVFGVSIDDWHRLSAFHTYVLLEPGSSADALEAQLSSFASTYMGERAEGLTHVLQPLTEAYLHSPSGAEPYRSGDPAYLYLFGAVAAIVLLIAGVNYVNLSTAKAAKRIQEVGIRKTVGANRGQIARQFIGEAVLVVTLALLIGLAIARFSLPVFEALFAVELAPELLPIGALAPSLLGVVLIVGVGAGSYPALLLSSYQPMDVLQSQTVSSGKLMRKGLVVFQFAISVALIVATVVVYQQLQYMQSEKLSQEGEQVLVIELEGSETRASYSAIKEELLRLPDVIAVTSASGAFAQNIATVYTQPDEGEQIGVNLLNVDRDFADVVALRITEGRNPSPHHTTDADGAALINQAAVRALSLSSPIGEELPIYGPGRRVEIVGVVEDFHYASLREEIEPLALVTGDFSVGYVKARIQTENLSRTLSNVEGVYQSFAPEFPFVYSFLNDNFAALYQEERRVGQIFGTFAGLAILLAALGLFGLAAFAAEHRRQEIGIRKVLGATASSIVALLSKDFLKLVLIGFLLAAPVAYYAMSRWLEDFAYRIEIGPMVFILAGLAAGLIALLTVSYQALRAAWMNPTEAIRNE